MDTKELENTVYDLMESREHIAQLREEIDLLTERHDKYKEQLIAAEWPHKDIKLIFRSGDVTISRVTTNTVKVVEPKSVITWLKRNKYKLEDFQKLDLVKLKPVLTSAIYTQGKNIQGVETETGKQSLRVSVAK